MALTPLATIGRIDVGTARMARPELRFPLKDGQLERTSDCVLSPLSAGQKDTDTCAPALSTTVRIILCGPSLVTSASPQEGKSTTVCNLAICFAQGENRVLLIDADMRRPTVHTLFGLGKDLGSRMSFSRSTFLRKWCKRES